MATNLQVHSVSCISLAFFPNPDPPNPNPEFVLTKGYYYSDNDFIVPHIKKIIYNDGNSLKHWAQKK